MQIEKQLLDLLAKLEKEELMSCPCCNTKGIQIDKAGIKHLCPTCKGWGLLKIPEPTFNIGYYTKNS